MLEMGGLEGALVPAAEALLRITVGLLLIPHGLRAFYGMFPNTGSRVLDFTALAKVLAEAGYRPGRFWAAVTWFVEFVAGPMLALGVLTRIAALFVFVFMLGSTVEHARVDGYFWNKLGLEYPLLWTIAALFFAVAGGGPYSVDHCLGW
ncbi:MAG: DoxX family protein [Alphaproteobacteria bacterium]|nr:DoxX family protein [Alphaproteobacteria bacterium]